MLPVHEAGPEECPKQEDRRRTVAGTEPAANVRRRSDPSYEFDEDGCAVPDESAF